MVTMDQDTIAVGVVGAGRIGQIHAQNLSSMPGVKLQAIVDTNLDAAGVLAKQCKVSHTSSDYREILEDESVKAVVVCTPTDTHADIIVEATNQGKDVFCEKPVDVSLAQIDKALSAVKKSGTTLQIGFHRRFDPHFARVREMVLEGKVGEVVLVRTTSRDPAPPSADYLRSSGGLFLDMAIHDYDLCRFFTGKEVSEVYAVGVNKVSMVTKEVGDVDTAVITLRFEDDSLATIDLCRATNYGYDQRVEVFGTKGVARVDNTRPTNVELGNELGFSLPNPYYFFPERYASCFRSEMNSFLEALRFGTEPAVTGVDGRKAFLIGEAATRSFKLKKPISISYT